MQRSAEVWFRFIARRVLLLTLALFGVVVFAFLATRKVGTPVYLMVGTEYSKEMVESAAERLGINKPILVQFGNYIKNLLHGHFGVSRFTYNPVTFDLIKRLPATVELALFAFFLIVLWSIPVGILSGTRKGGCLDRIACGVSSIGVAVAQFWLGLMLIYIFYFRLHWFPAPMGRLAPNVSPPKHLTGLYVIDSLLTGNRTALLSSLAHLFLPGFTLAFTVSPYIFSLVRTSTSQIVDSEFILSARAFGLGSRVIRRYLARNVAPPVLTILGLNLALLLGGAVLVEVVFSWPGIGYYAVNAMQLSDYDPVIAVVLFNAIVLSVMYFVVDIINAMIDPRWRLS